jgi:hypothetical protein
MQEPESILRDLFDPGFGVRYRKIGIREGSGINISDPQHCVPNRTCQYRREETYRDVSYGRMYRDVSYRDVSYLDEVD